MYVVPLTTTEPITLPDAKAWLQVDYTDQDDVIRSIITAARQKLERRCGISIALKRFRMTLPAFSATITLEYPPVREIASVKYLSTDGSEKTVDPAAYTLIEDRFEPYIFPLADWPSDVARRPDAVRVEFVSGIYGDDSPPEQIDQDLMQAMRWLISHFYENRESTALTPVRQEIQEVPDTVEAIIAPYIVPRL